MTTGGSHSPLGVSFEAEWLEADGLGGFASGTVGGARTRRYHALLLAATTPPTGRMALVGGMEVTATTSQGQYALSNQCYAPGVTHPDGANRLTNFSTDPWPTWRYRLEDGTEIEQSVCVPRGYAAAIISWRLVQGSGPLALSVQPFLSGCDYHALHHENPAFRFDAEASGSRVVWRPYDGVPAIVSLSNGDYQHALGWYRNFLYAHEVERGLDATEDLASPGVLEFNLVRGEAIWILTAAGPNQIEPRRGELVTALANRLREDERRRAKFASPLHRAADVYIVERGKGQTIIAGYPWFTDWGRDTFIALRGLCLATGRLEDARAILLAWSREVDGGMLPNRFSDHGDQKEFNSVDASLWFVIAAHDFFVEAGRTSFKLASEDRQAIVAAILAIVSGYARGVRHGIRATEDGLLEAGVSGLQLTWMDAKVGDWVVTPRIGKPVEVQALWLNALAIARQYEPEWQEMFERGRRSFLEKFVNHERGCLFDVVDVDHVPGRKDASLRPNQLFAIGGLPLALVEGPLARAIVDLCEEQLWTPLGPRTLAPSEPGYSPRYEGDVWRRDGAYHQGTVWPWLAGVFVEAWVRTHGDSAEARSEARRRFVEPLAEQIGAAGLGHLPEIADAEAPHAPRGCPWQAWSLGEFLRLTESVLKDREQKIGAPKSR